MQSKSKRHMLSCIKMKMIFRHAESCKIKSNQQQSSAQLQAPICPICRQHIALYCYHVKNYTRRKCLVTYCTNIKYKIKQRQLQQLMANMNLGEQ